MNIRYPIYEGVYRILTDDTGNDRENDFTNNPKIKKRMNTNQKTRLKAEDMEWNVLKTLGLSKEQLEADGSMERLLQGMETEAIPLKFRTPVIDLSMDATLRLVPGPGGKPVLEIKGISPEKEPEA